MTRRFLSQAERERLSEFPPEISDNDLIVYFSLTPADMAAIQQQRTPHTQLGFALLLGTLRYLGFFPVKWDSLPEVVVTYVAQQVAVTVESLSAYLARAENRWEQFGPVMQHLGFRRATATDQAVLIEWLSERALENERPAGLLQLACERLYYLRLVRPAVTTLEEGVADARQQAWTRTVQVLVDPLPSEQKRRLTDLLEPMAESPLTPLAWLRRSARGYSATDILDTLAKLAYIRRWPIREGAVSALPSSRLKYLAQLARHTSSQGLQRKRPVTHQQAILIAFLHGAHQKLVDELIDLFDQGLAEVLRKARRELKEYQLAHLAQVEQVVTYFQTMSEVILDEAVPDQAVRSTIYDRIAAAQLQTALAVTQQLRAKGRPLTDLDFFDRRYSYFRRFGPAFLAALTFQSPAEDDRLLAAIAVLRELNVQEDKLPAVLTDRFHP